MCCCWLHCSAAGPARRDEITNAPQLLHLPHLTPKQNHVCLQQKRHAAPRNALPSPARTKTQTISTVGGGSRTADTQAMQRIPHQGPGLQQRVKFGAVFRARRCSLCAGCLPLGPGQRSGGEEGARAVAAEGRAGVRRGARPAGCEVGQHGVPCRHKRVKR
jgi:hypothetical protein